MSNCQNCPEFGKHSFCALSEEARSFLDANAIDMDYPSGSILFHEGDRCSTVFVVCSGRVKLSTTSREGRTMILRIAKPGDALGIGAAIAETPYEVTAEVLDRSRIRVLRRPALMSMLAQHSETTMAAAKSLADDYRCAFAEAKLFGLTAAPAGRLARLLLGWLGESSLPGRPSTISMALTHEELASMTGTSRETITRTLSRFRKDKVISTHGIALTVLQPALLEKLSA